MPVDKFSRHSSTLKRPCDLIQMSAVSLLSDGVNHEEFEAADKPV